jgi:hypothetical protein
MRAGPSKDSTRRILRPHHSVHQPAVTIGFGVRWRRKHPCLALLVRCACVAAIRLGGYTHVRQPVAGSLVSVVLSSGFTNQRL